jgi:glycosyltransferase involved in cell wall biosynthesis
MAQIADDGRLAAAEAHPDGLGALAVAEAPARPRQDRDEDEPPLRILHVAEAFGGGVFEVVRILANGSARRGHAVAIAHGTRPETPSPIGDRLEPQVELVSTAWVKRSVQAQIEVVPEIRSLARRWRPDIIHLHSSFAGVIGATSLAGLAPTVYSPHGYSFEMRNRSFARRSVYRLLERYVGRRVDTVGAISIDEAALASRAVGARSVAVVQNGIPELDVPPAGRALPRTSPPITVAMGRISPQRQPAACARIMRRLRRHTAAQWIGGGADTPWMAELADAGVTVTGWLERDEALATLAQATVYLHWTAWDGQPLSVLEAMARDVLVVAHDIPPMRELLEPRQLCRDEDAAVSLIARVLENEDLLETLLAGQRTRARQYGADRMIDGWHHLYQDIARRSCLSR